eukprot:2354282-Rhodomonas_salina.2
MLEVGAQIRVSGQTGDSSWECLCRIPASNAPERFEFFKGHVAKVGGVPLPIALSAAEFGIATECGASTSCERLERDSRVWRWVRAAQHLEPGPQLPDAQE